MTEIQQPTSVEEYESRIRTFLSKAGDIRFSYPYVLGIIEAIVKFDEPAERLIEEIRNVLSAHNRLLGNIPADRDPQPAG